MAPSVMQLRDHEEFLDVIDRLRSQGLNHYVHLPQIIVCGDQSSGKSSVLEAISNVKFPIQDDLCTRFATELILRRSTTESVTISIQPGKYATKSEQERLRSFNPHTHDLNDFPKIVEAAKIEMGLNTGTKPFSDDMLRVDITGPKQPNVTLVDLPGVIHAAENQQPEDEEHVINLVSELVKTYMANEKSIILAVVSAKSDLALQKVTVLARKADPQGKRTLGIITKPDTLAAGSESETKFVNLAKNEKVHFRLGWHVLRNRDFVTREFSDAERDEAEREFFSQGIWTSLSTKVMGIEALKPRLSQVLKDQIMTELPSLMKEIQSGIDECQSRLSRVGAARGDQREQKDYLMEISQSFSSLIGASVDGRYYDEFFGDAMSDIGYSKRLRAVLQNLMTEFAAELQNDGQSQIIVEHIPETDSTDQSKAKRISRSAYIDGVQERVRRSRGCELPGTFNPLIIGDLFFQQSKQWSPLILRYTARVLDAATTCLELILEYIADDTTSDGLMRELIHPAIGRYAQTLEQKVAEIVRPHQQGHPITYNHYFTETIQKARQSRSRQEQEKKSRAFFGVGLSGFVPPRSEGFHIKDLLDHLNSQGEAEMDRFACSEAVFCMEAYYKVALKTVVDNVAVLGVESRLMQVLTTTFSPKVVMHLDNDMISRIASESEESRTERSLAGRKLDTLENSLQALKGLGRQKPQRDTRTVLGTSDMQEAFESAWIDSISQEAPAGKAFNAQDERLREDVPQVPQPPEAEQQDWSGWGFAHKNLKKAKKSKKPMPGFDSDDC